MYERLADGAWHCEVPPQVNADGDIWPECVKGCLRVSKTSGISAGRSLITGYSFLEKEKVRALIVGEFEGRALVILRWTAREEGIEIE